MKDNETKFNESSIHSLTQNRRQVKDTLRSLIQIKKISNKMERNQDDSSQTLHASKDSSVLNSARETRSRLTLWFCLICVEQIYFDRKMEPFTQELIFFLKMAFPVILCVAQ